MDPFAKLATTLRDADIAVCNLECVIAEGGEPERKAYTFRADIVVPYLHWGEEGEAGPTPAQRRWPGG